MEILFIVISPSSLFRASFLHADEKSTHPYKPWRESGTLR